MQRLDGVGSAQFKRLAGGDLTARLATPADPVLLGFEPLLHDTFPKADNGPPNPFTPPTSEDVPESQLHRSRQVDLRDRDLAE
jgi:hypothetical protein